MARFTIGIPTYNRANFLRGALKAACDQTWPDVEVLVSDNASTDETPEVVRSYGERVRYHRNAENIGMWPNFFRLAELAGGEYFSWLQDDELIHCDFARRAIGAFESGENTVVYTSYSIVTYSYDTFVLPTIYGPPVPMDWMHSRLRVIEGFLVMPISFFASFSIPPVTAYRTEAIRCVEREVDPESILYNERIIQTKAVADGKVAIDPWLAGTFYMHEAQGSRLAGSTEITERSRQWMHMADKLCRMLEERPDKDWRPLLAAWLENISPHDSITLLYQLPPIQYWSQFHPLTYEICSQLLNRVPEYERRGYLASVTNGDDNKKSFKDFGRQLTPPLLWDVLRRIKSNLTTNSK